MLSDSPRRASSYSNSAPSSCIAMSLKASVGPLDSATSASPSPIGLSGVIASVPNTALV
jgi:hypothetical protein